jgi:hypothetical protein
LSGTLRLVGTRARSRVPQPFSAISTSAQPSMRVTRHFGPTLVPLPFQRQSDRFSAGITRAS